ncbi:capsid assembly protease C [Yersinia phage vB_YenM_P778]
MNFLRISDMLFNQPLLATESMASQVATYIQSRMFGNSSEADLAVNFNKPVGDASQYLRVSQGTAILPVMGSLTHRAMGMEALCTGGMSSYAGMTKAFDEAIADSSVERIVLHVDSGGGQATGCFDLAHHIMANRGKKPIIAYVDGMACSAAYALACSADEVIASPHADVGSIGVIMVHQEASVALEKAGISTTVIKAGANKGMGSPFAPLSEDAKNTLQDRVDELYSDFVGLVSSARSIDAKDVRSTEASVYNAQASLEKGLIDSIKTPDEFLAYITPNSPSSVAQPIKVRTSMEEQSQETEMSEAEMKELAELRAFKAAQEATQSLSVVVGTVQASADAIGFDSTEAATALLSAGLDNQLSVLFMNVVQNASTKLAEFANQVTALKAEHEVALADVKASAQVAVETSEAMTEIGAEGAAELVEEVSTELAHADDRNAALIAAMAQMYGKK